MTTSCTATRHGDALAYQVDRCRCPSAREAYRVYRKRLREGRHPPAHVDACGTARRLQGLAALGWSFSVLAARVGTDRRTLQQRTTGRFDRVHRRTHDTVVALYDELSTQPGPSNRTRRRALAAGWAVPALWDDDAIDDPDARPATDPPRRRGAHGRVDLADVDHLASYGYTPAAIAARLDVDVESIAQARRRAAARAARPDTEGGRLAS